MDPKFIIKVIARTERPQQVIYAAMHQDYCEEYVGLADSWMTIDEAECGHRVVNHLLKGNRGHYGPLEHPHITLACGYYPHSVMQQLRTHRVGITFDVQSMRYTGQRVGIDDVENVIYVRPVGTYTDRSGKRYDYTNAHRSFDLQRAESAMHDYRIRVDTWGQAPEHARGMLPFDYRQHWVMTVNARSLMHILDLRWKSDAQLECQWFCDQLIEVFRDWCPQIAEWYVDNRGRKARLSP